MSASEIPLAWASAGPDEPIRVLHVDDDRSLAALSAEYLEREDDRIAVHFETRPSEGVEYVEANAVDCVVCDYDMPEMNGLELLDAVREAFPRLPFILFTGKGSEEIASEAITRGVTDYLQKRPGTEQYQLLANRILNHVERTRARRALEARESHLKQAQAVADIGSWYTDIRSDDIYWSEAVYDIFEIDESEVSLDHERFLDFVHPEDSEYVDRKWAEALDGEAYDIEHRIVTGTGETRWVRERAVVEFDDGDPVSALGVVQDITGRKARVERLRRTTPRLEALFENSPDMINVHDTEGNIIDPNPRLCEKTGYDEEDLVGMKVWDLDRTVSAEGVRSVWEGMEIGDQYRTEGVYRREDGSEFPVEVHLRRLDIEGEDRFVVISRDITEQRRRERELERHTERLEAFASEVTQNLREPLDAAGSRIDRARAECDSPHLDDAATALDRMAELLEDLDSPKRRPVTRE
jgi:PAS domain S-box-containing protein